MAGIVIATLGSRGDLFPFIPIGLRLRERGHTVTFAAAPAFAPLVAAEGFPFRPLPGPVSFEEYRRHSEVFDPRWNGLASLRALMRAFILPELKKVVASLSEACRAIHWRRFTKRRLRGALERVLKVDYVERAARLAEELAIDDGVGRACAEIERIL